MPIVTEFRESKQYDGTNGTSLVTEFLDSTAYTVTSDTGTQLVFTDFEGTRKKIPLNGWIIRDSSRSLMWSGSDAAYLAQWAVI
ncbi:hypothetical protein ACFV1F_16780 [Streptomyces sp. NPDC059590]|uniref:hypothetical protein n=1 Tax=Streptomyces sp. NPDC059590 TaxID=3346877 RepID=UPI0036B70785